jgi:hypothetical protein
MSTGRQSQITPPRPCQVFGFNAQERLNWRASQQRFGANEKDKELSKLFTVMENVTLYY